MKYFVRILAFLFISFSSLFGYSVTTSSFIWANARSLSDIGFSQDDSAISFIYNTDPLRSFSFKKINTVVDEVNNLNSRLSEKNITVLYNSFDEGIPTDMVDPFIYFLFDDDPVVYSASLSENNVFKNGSYPVIGNSSDLFRIFPSSFNYKTYDVYVDYIEGFGVLVTSDFGFSIPNLYKNETYTFRNTIGESNTVYFDINGYSDPKAKVSRLATFKVARAEDPGSPIFAFSTGLSCPLDGDSTFNVTYLPNTGWRHNGVSVNSNSNRFFYISCDCPDGERYSNRFKKCVPKCVNPENGEQGYYNYDKGRCEFCSFGATFDEKTETCSNWKCFQLENKMERFDCMCREGGHGAGVNSQILVTGAGTDCSITCEDGLRISTISNFNVFKQLFDTVFNGGYVQTTFSNPTKFCTVDNSINIDLVDPSDSEAEQAGSQSGKQSSEQSSEQAGSKSTEQSGKQGGEQGGSQTAEQGGEQGGEQGSSKSVEQNSKQSSEQAGSQSGKQSSEQSSKQSSEQAGSQDGEQAGVSKGTITIKDPVTGEEEVVEIGKNKKENSISYRDPETGNQVEIKPKDETGGNIITITDTITGETKTVEIGKNDNRKNEISYKDPYTGKDVIIELSPKDTDKTDNSQAESGKADNSQAEGDKKNNDDFEFKGPNLGALGNANDFDKGGELASLYDSLSEKESENNGILDSIISDGFGLVNDIKQSIDNIKETAEDLKNNPFSSSSVTSCAIDLNILETSSQIDLCKYTSQFKALFSSIFFVFLNIVVGFAFFKILILLLINI